MSSVMQQPRTQYVYDFSSLDAVPEGPTSARVAAKRLLSGPTLATGKSSTIGAVLTEELDVLISSLTFLQKVRIQERRAMCLAAACR